MSAHQNRPSDPGAGHIDQQQQARFPVDRDQKAAARLGISRRTLSRKLKLYDSEGVRAAL